MGGIYGAVCKKTRDFSVLVGKKKKEKKRKKIKRRLIVRM